MENHEKTNYWKAISMLGPSPARVRSILFTSDNFNKYPQAETLPEAMIEEQLGLELFVQCYTQIALQEHLVSLLTKARCFQMFVGAKSYNRQALLAAHKVQHRPEKYQDIVRLCRECGISSYFSNPTGFSHWTLRKRSKSTCSAARYGPDLGFLSYPLPDSRHRAVRRLSGSGLDQREEPQPLRHDVPYLATPQSLARTAVGFAILLLSQFFLGAARAAKHEERDEFPWPRSDSKFRGELAMSQSLQLPAADSRLTTGGRPALRHVSRSDGDQRSGLIIKGEYKA